MPEKVFTLEDLRNWARPVASFAVVGKPIAHSLSPKMHNAAFAKFLPGENAEYFKFEIAPEQLGDALSLFFEKNFRGLNLTIPHKVIALPFLKKISPAAEIIGATNTLSRDDALGGFRGGNTDGEGFRRAAENALACTLAGADIVLLGAGGAARAIAATALANKCASLTIANRSREKADALADAMRKHFPSAKIFCADAKNVSVENSLLVNATSLGLAREDPSPFPPENLHGIAAVYDTTYGAHESALVSAARARGIPASDGREMLAWQGALAFEIWNGVPAEQTAPVMREAARV